MIPLSLAWQGGFGTAIGPFAGVRVSSVQDTRVSMLSPLAALQLWYRYEQASWLAGWLAGWLASAE